LQLQISIQFQSMNGGTTNRRNAAYFAIVVHDKMSIPVIVAWMKQAGLCLRNFIPSMQMIALPQIAESASESSIRNFVQTFLR